MSVIRAFIAIDLPSEIGTKLHQVTDRLKQQVKEAPVRWVPADNIHLTLKFLGDVSVASLDMLQKVLLNEVSIHHSFEFSVGGLGAFPNSRHPRVLWVGVEAPPELSSIQRGVEAAMARLGYAREERPFTAHLTLGRVSRNVTPHDSHLICDAIEKTKIGFLGVAPVDAVHLYRSDLQSSGAVYTRMFSAPLAVHSQQAN